VKERSLNKVRVRSRELYRPKENKHDMCCALRSTIGTLVDNGGCYYNGEIKKIGERQCSGCARSRQCSSCDQSQGRQCLSCARSNGRQCSCSIQSPRYGNCREREPKERERERQPSLKSESLKSESESLKSEIESLKIESESEKISCPSFHFFF
jgi:hypothetical protein